LALNFPDNPSINQIHSDETAGFYYRWDGTVWQSFSPGSSSNIKTLDDVSSSFNGITTSFSLTSGGVAITPISPAQIVINLGGVVQDPSDDYYVSASNIIFTDPPDLGASFSGISLGPAVPISNILDGSVFPQDLSTGGPWWQSDYKVGINTTVPTSLLDVKGDALIAGIATATTISATNVRSTNINATGIITANNVVAGAAQTSLIVLGDARITGILTIGTASITLNGTNNTGTIGTSRIVSLAAGIKTLFYESTAPTGWTKVTTHHDKCMRVVNTSGGGSGGASAFSAVMTSRTPGGSVSGSNSGGSVANTTATGSVSGSNSGGSVTGSVSGSNSGGSVSLTTLSTATIPNHTHTYTFRNQAQSNPGGTGATWFGTITDDTGGTGGSGAHGHAFTNPSWSGSWSQGTFTNPSWSGSISINAHNHSLTQPTWNGSFSGSAMDFNIQYIDLLLCSID
jgi:hypothetical protein